MKRWDNKQNTEIEAPDVDAFLQEIIAVCRKHDMSLGHEDGHGAFEVTRGFDEGAAEWLSAAQIT